MDFLYENVINFIFESILKIISNSLHNLKSTLNYHTFLPIKGRTNYVFFGPVKISAMVEEITARQHIFILFGQQKRWLTKSNMQHTVNKAGQEQLWLIVKTKSSVK